MAKGIFIEGLKKPKQCSRHCLFADNENYDCVLIADSAWFDTFEEQHRHCPLVEVDTEQIVEEGNWIDQNDMDEMYGHIGECSVCGAESFNVFGYCPYCGARMRGENDVHQNDR